LTTPSVGVVNLGSLRVFFLARERFFFKKSHWLIQKNPSWTGLAEENYFWFSSINSVHEGFFLKSDGCWLRLLATNSGYGFQIFSQFFWESRGILEWSIMLITDWLLRQFLPKNESWELYRELCSWINWQLLVYVNSNLKLVLISFYTTILSIVEIFFRTKYLFLKTSDLTNPNREALTTPKCLKSQKNIFVSCIRMNPWHLNEKSNFARQNHMNNKLQL